MILIDSRNTPSGRHFELQKCRVFHVVRRSFIRVLGFAECSRWRKMRRYSEHKLWALSLPVLVPVSRLISTVKLIEEPAIEEGEAIRGNPAASEDGGHP